MESEFSVTNLLTKEDNPRISVSSITLKGLNLGSINMECAAVYICTEGTVTFCTFKNGACSLKILKPGDHIYIPPLTPYVDFSEGGAGMLVINKRAFDPDKVIQISMPDNFLGYMALLRSRI